MDKRRIAQLIIARLDGDQIDSKYDYYRSLVRKGIGGFIVFGGEARKVGDGIRKLQKRAEYPLFIASDLEQGLGQQIRGGTLFPPAMAIASAIDRNKREDVRLLRDVIDTIAIEARAVGINLILTPVADVNTNPENPIICTRSFSSDPGEVSWFVKEYTRGIQRHGIMACVKHFPGHGDASVDSHLAVPVINADMKRLENVEFYPFRGAIKAGVRMVMIGHLMVPAIDSELSTFSKKTVTEILKERMGFRGLITTDAMNMKAVKEQGDNAYMMAIKAGIDIILHPEDPEKTIEVIYRNRDSIMPEINKAFVRVIRAKRWLRHGSIDIRNVGRKSHTDLSMKIAERFLKIDYLSISRMRHILSSNNIMLLVIDDDNLGSGDILYQSLKSDLKGLRYIYVDNKYKDRMDSMLKAISGKPVIIAIFSGISGFKGRGFLSRRLKGLLKRALHVAGHSVVIGFCCPYNLRDIEADVIIKAYSDTLVTQECVSRLLCRYIV
jgi:beta-glucosidase-like glycosyl hydrolase